MPKSIVATDIDVESLSLQANETGAVTRLIAYVIVAYGDARVRESFDLWANLTPAQRANFQAIYDTLDQQLQASYFA